jgi:hypothetical protein
MCLALYMAGGGRIPSREAWNPVFPEVQEVGVRAFRLDPLRHPDGPESSQC